MRNYQALGAILTLKEFDAAELARYSRLPVTTVYTILRRNASLFEEIGKKATGKPGGKPIRYRVKPDQLVKLEKQREEMSARLNLKKEGRTVSHAKESHWLPAELLSAERILLKRFPHATLEMEKTDLLTIAKIAFLEEEAIHEKPPLVRSHLRCLAALYELCEAELHPEESRSRFAGICKELADATDALVDAGDQKRAGNMLRRLTASPLMDSPPIKAAAVDAMTSGSVSDPAVPPPMIESVFRDYALVPAIPEPGAAGRTVEPFSGYGADARGMHVVPIESLYTARGLGWRGSRSGALSRESLEIIKETERISGILNPYMRIQAAVRAAQAKRFPGGPANCESHIAAFLNRIYNHGHVLLTNAEIELLATLPAFYCQKLSRSGYNYLLRVRPFLSDLEKYRTTHRPAYKGRHYQQEQQWGELYEFAGSR